LNCERLKFLSSRINITFYFLFLFSNCTSIELISPGLNSSSELEQIYFKTADSIRRNDHQLYNANIRAFKIFELEDLMNIINDENNDFFEDENFHFFKDLNLNNYDYYLFSFEIPPDSQRLNTSDIKISNGSTVPEKTIYTYDYIHISKSRGGMAGSFESMTHTNELYPLRPESRYNHNPQTYAYGHTEINYLRTVRVLCKFNKLLNIKKNSNIQIKLNSKIEMKFYALTQSERNKLNLSN